MLQDDRSGGEGRRGPSRNVFGEPLVALDQPGDGLLSGRLLQHGAGRRWQPHHLCRHHCRVYRIFQIAWQRSLDPIAEPRLCRPQTRRSLVFMCAPLAGSTRSRPSAPRGVARHSRGGFELLLSCRPQAICGRLGVTVGNNGPSPPFGTPSRDRAPRSQGSAERHPI